jgi:hypothetical protein
MENKFEESQIEHELEAQHEMEKIKIAEAKLMDKYGGYKALASFVIYLSSMEKVFARSAVYDSSQAIIKEEIIKTEMQLFSVNGALEKDVLLSIRDDFSLVYMTVSQVYEIAEKLLQKFSNNEDCKNFIKSLRDISIIFIEAHEKGLSVNQIQDRIYKSQMELLTADGDPKLEVLEQIYGEFKVALGKIGK